jgi:hypothetical protein
MIQLKIWEAGINFESDEAE